MTTFAIFNFLVLSIPSKVRRVGFSVVNIANLQVKFHKSSSPLWANLPIAAIPLKQISSWIEWKGYVCVCLLSMSASSFFCVCVCAFVCVCACLCYGIYPLITKGRVSALGSVVKDWLSSQWCQWPLTQRGKPLQCHPLNRTLTAACLCWTSAHDSWRWTDPDRGQHSARGTGGRACGMLGNEIRWDQGAGSWQPVTLHGCEVGV